MYALYEALLWLAFLVALPWFAVVGFLRGKYWGNLRERFGRYRSRPGRHDVWIHAVSVGEVAAAVPLVKRLRELRPDLELVITTTTNTGQEIAHRQFPFATVTWFPLDFAFAVRRFLRHHQPRLYATIETEIWPNAARISDEQGMGVILVNGRISDRSFGRYRAVQGILRRVFRHYDAVLVRSEADRERFAAIGADPKTVSVAGNLKFDLELPVGDPPPVVAEVARLATGRPIFITGSTMEGEDQAILQFLPGLIARGCFVVMAPRKPERFEIVAGLLTTSNLRWARRTEMEGAPAAGADVFLLDSIGELARLYEIAAAAFVGGSLVPVGGHNPIEPAAFGVPVAFGPSMSNFREIAETFLAAGGAVQVESAEELIAFAIRMIEEPEAREALGRAGREVVDANRGAADRSARAVLEVLGS